jgi:hypothetical protein
MNSFVNAGEIIRKRPECTLDKKTQKRKEIVKY